MGTDSAYSLNDVIMMHNGRVMGKVQSMSMSAVVKEKPKSYKEFNSATMSAKFKYVRLHNCMENEDYLSLLEEN